jgi:hypothetical protein
MAYVDPEVARQAGMTGDQAGTAGTVDDQAAAAGTAGHRAGAGPADGDPVTRLAVDVRGRAEPATATTLPFYQRPR